MKFRYKFTTVFLVLFGVIYLLAAACFVWNLVRLLTAITNSIDLNSFNYISIALCLFVPILFAVFATAALIRSEYVVCENTLILRFGFVKERYSVADIRSVVKNVRLDKLTLIFKDESTMAVVIDPKCFDDFSSALMKLNKNIVYGESDDENAEEK